MPSSQSPQTIAALTAGQTRLNAVRQAYWDNSDQADSDFNALYDALSGLDIVPTITRVRALFLMLPAEIIGKGIAWEFGDTEVRDNIWAFVDKNRDAVQAAVGAVGYAAHSPR